MATHLSVLTWRIHTERGTWLAAVHRVTELDMKEATWHAQTQIMQNDRLDEPQVRIKVAGRNISNFRYVDKFGSVTPSRPTLYNPTDCMQHDRFPVHHQLLEPTQTHVLRVIDAIQPSHPLSSPSPPAFNLSQHQGLFQ